MTPLHRQTEQRSLSAVLARLNAIRTLTPGETARIAALNAKPYELPAGAALFEEGAPVRTAFWIVYGWAAQQRLLSDGRRQIVHFLLPGDGIGLCRRPNALASTGVVALTRLLVVDATPVLRGPSQDGEDLDALFQTAAAIDEQRLINNVVRLGRLSAYERLCNLLLELHDRLSEVNEADAGRLPLPVTQEALADALGLSVVHINRTLQQLRLDRLVEVASGHARLLDYAALERAASYTRPCLR
jgi:CRP-like cAMP-binding protein